jgi:phage anti-repressor protein
MASLSIVPSVSSFVQPHFIQELGEEGLTLKEISTSLGIDHNVAKVSLEKNINNYVNRQKFCFFNSNGLEVTSYHLSTEDAKLFVASYNNEAGWGYRKFLIQCEKKLKEVTSQPKSLAAQQLQMMLQQQLQLDNIEEKQIKQEEKLALVEAKLDDAIEVKFPEGCISREECKRRYWSQFSIQHMMNYLHSVSHPTKSHTSFHNGGLFTNSVFVEAGMNQRVINFTNSLELVKESDKTTTYKCKALGDVVVRVRK